MSDCVHHWLLGEPVEGRVAGVCMYCNAEKSWKSVYDAYSFNPINLMRDPLLSRAEGSYRLTYGETW